MEIGNMLKRHWVGDRTYLIETFWSSEDSCYFARCSEYPYLSSFGDDRLQATDIFVEVLKGID